MLTRPLLEKTFGRGSQNFAEYSAVISSFDPLCRIDRYLGRNVILNTEPFELATSFCCTSAESEQQ